MRFLPILLLAVGCLQSVVSAQYPATPTPSQAPSQTPREQERRALIESAPLLFSSFVFAGADFPKVDFQQPSLMKEVAGDYTLQMTFYDANYNLVTQANVAGRYGAIVQVTPQTGPPFQRTFTLYRQSAPVDWSAMQKQFTAELPPEFGIQAGVLAERSNLWKGFTQEVLADSLPRYPKAAILLAGLHEAKFGDGNGSWNSPSHRDETWWYGLKKKLGQVEPTRYLIDLPAGYDENPDRKWPLVIFLHGSGEGGTDLNLLRRQGLPKLIAQGQQFPFILVSPQAPKNYLLGTQVVEVLDEVARKYRVDADRVILTGLSMGGNSTWFTALEFPDRFAAIVPIAASGDPGGAARLKRVPTWYFVGARDTNIKLERAQQMVEAMKAAQVPFQFTLYLDASHAQTWEKAYADPELYRWMMNQKRQH